MDCNGSCSNANSVSNSVRLADVRLRFICPADIPLIKTLCQDWFPIEYPPQWYEDIATSERFYPLAATVEGQIVGMLVAEVKPRNRVNREDSNLLSVWCGTSAKVAYILSLGVTQEYRRAGVASLLLQSLLAYVTSPEMAHVKAVYLHVLATNEVALRFYEKHDFRGFSLLPMYYTIRSDFHDGYCYALYINGGYPPLSFKDALSIVCGWTCKFCRSSMDLGVGAYNLAQALCGGLLGRFRPRRIRHNFSA